MKILFVSAIAICSYSVVSAQELCQLPPLVIQQVDRIGGNAYLQSPDLIRAGIGDQLASLGWPKYTVLPAESPYTGLYLNYSLIVLERTESSSNAWNATPLQFFPELSRFWASYSQSAYDTRRHFVTGIELWGIADTGCGNGRIEIARGRGGSAGVFNYLPFQGGSSYVGISGGSHSSSHSSYMTDPMPFQEQQLLQEAVSRMFTDLEGKLRQRNYSFTSSPSSPQLERGGPPDQHPEFVKDLAGVPPAQLTVIKGSRFVAECRDPGRCINGSCGAHDCKVPFSLKGGRLYCQLPNYQGRQLHFYK